VKNVGDLLSDGWNVQQRRTDLKLKSSIRKKRMPNTKRGVSGSEQQLGFWEVTHTRGKGKKRRG